MDGFFSNLESWVKRQSMVKEMFEKAEQNYKELDRLALITLSRLAFQHMGKTIEAFDQWLKDPMITSHMPREMLVELWSRLRVILYELIELDIEHTSKFSEHLRKLAEENALNPLFAFEKEEKETRRGVSPTI
ncbi:DUF2153 domain-containing protein [Desulfurococcus amylolyticus]|uniref:Uncharacterized conserved protein UCP008210 n=1 Tax=Desulfurococcus amylolyticus DSM 16532 TaxID=768672 RepID=I3XQ05_DESAM|nr:DUF2153 domain-containing protein [Desulfurococcus amylolyticus]AFL66029.1 Uncharacterized conserved protein UCP008210 [Desulfurococcus amylolyticus DSM 16532]